MIDKKSYPYLRAATRCGSFIAVVLGIPITAITLYVGRGDLRSSLEFLTFVYLVDAVFLAGMGLARGTRPRSVDYAKTIPATMMSEKGTGKELRRAIDETYLADTDTYACAFMAGIIFLILAVIMAIFLSV